MKRTVHIFMVFLFVFVICSFFVRGAEEKKSIRVAVSIYNVQPAFLRQWLADLKRHPAVLDGRVELHPFDCTGSSASQHMHFETLSAMRFDAVIVVANDMHASERLVDMLEGSGIPVVASCAQTADGRLDAFIGPDDIRAGYLTAVSVAEEMGGRGNVVVLRWPMDQGAVQHRNIGIAEALGHYVAINEIRSIPANWSRAESMEIIQGIIDRNEQIDGIIAQNDEMALGAIEVLKINALADIPVASIDGLAPAVAAVYRGELLQTLRQDSVLQAQGALDLALRKIIGPEYIPESPAWGGQLLEQWEKGKQHRYIVPWEVVTAAKN